MDLGGLRIESPTNYSNYSTTKLIKSGTAWLRHLVGSSIASRNLKRPHHDWFIGSCWCYSYCRNWNILKYTEILWKWPEYVWINLGIFFFHDIQCTVMLYTLVHLSAALVFSSVSNLELCIRNLYAGRCLIACGAFPALPRCISLLYGNCIILVLVLRVMCMMFAWTHRTCQALTEPQMPNGRELSSDSGVYIYRERECVCEQSGNSSKAAVFIVRWLLHAQIHQRKGTRTRTGKKSLEQATSSHQQKACKYNIMIYIYIYNYISYMLVLAFQIHAEMRMITYPLGNAIPHANTEISTILMTVVQESQAELWLPSFITILDLGMGQNYCPQNDVWTNCKYVAKDKRYSALNFAGPSVSMFYLCAFFLTASCCVAGFLFLPVRQRGASGLFWCLWPIQVKFSSFFFGNSFQFHENCPGAKRLAPCKSWMLGCNCRWVSKVYY